MDDEIQYRWLRIRYARFEDQNNVKPRHQINAVRNDGQQFCFWKHTDGTNTDAIKRDLFEELNAHLNDPAMPPTVDEDGVSWSNQVSPNSYKGAAGWEEL